MNITLSDNFTKDIREILRRRVHLKHGDAQYYLDRIGDIEQLAVLRNDEGSICGWSVIIYGYKPYRPSCWVYVSKSYRSQGFGTRLVQLVKPKYSNVDYCNFNSPECPYRVKFWAKQGLVHD